MYIKFFLFLGLFATLFGCTSAPIASKVRSTVTHFDLKKEYIVGRPIEINAEVSAANSPDLTLCTYGLEGLMVFAVIEAKKDRYTFRIPENFTKKIGWYYVYLKSKQNVILCDSFKIVSDKEAVKIENFLGHQYLLTNMTTTASIMTNITDKYGNAIGQNDTLDLYEFKEDKQNLAIRIPIKQNVGFYYLPQFTDEGKYFISTAYKNLKSKLHTLSLASKNAKPFVISYLGYNGLADGYQLIKFKTSEIKDEKGNVIPNGTIVFFKIMDQYGKNTSSYGVSYNGYAETEIVQPSYKTTWTISSGILNIVSSPNITLSFESAIDTIPVKVQKNKVRIGSLFTKHNYIVPEGTTCNVKILKESKMLYNENKKFESGIITLDLKDYFLKKNVEYDLKLNVLGVEKNIKIVYNE